MSLTPLGLAPAAAAVVPAIGMSLQLIDHALQARADRREAERASQAGASPGGEGGETANTQRLPEPSEPPVPLAPATPQPTRLDPDASGPLGPYGGRNSSVQVSPQSALEVAPSPVVPATPGSVATVVLSNEQRLDNVEL